MRRIGEYQTLWPGQQKSQGGRPYWEKLASAADPSEVVVWFAKGYKPIVMFRQRRRATV